MIMENKDTKKYLEKEIENVMKVVMYQNLIASKKMVNVSIVKVDIMMNLAVRNAILIA